MPVQKQSRGLKVAFPDRIVAGIARLPVITGLTPEGEARVEPGGDRAADNPPTSTLLASVGEVTPAAKLLVGLAAM